LNNSNVADAIHWEGASDTQNLVQHVAAKIREAIAKNSLRSGERIPSSRELARQLGISRGTVVTALELLTAEGLLIAKVGAGTFVSDDARCVQNTETRPPFRFVEPSRQISEPRSDNSTTRLIDFRPCRPTLEAFPLAAWRRCLSAASASMPQSDYGDPRGAERLRESIACYLRRARGLSTMPDEIIVTNGAIHAMHLVATLYLNNRSKVVMEDPGYPLARQIFELSQAEIVSCRVDEDGLCIEDLPKAMKFRLVYVTPSHQFPTGGRLSLGRRRALIEWAFRNDALILEDDYDGEFRYDVPPLSPLAAMSHGNVIYCGTFSKTMFPDLRIGFAVAPKPIIDTLTKYRTITEYAPNNVIQLALALFIEEGHYERHIHRMRRLYASKRKILAQALEEVSERVELVGLDSGINGLVRLHGQTRATTLSKKAQKNGALVPPLSLYTTMDQHIEEALVLGYGALSEDDIRRGVDIIFG